MRRLSKLAACLFAASLPAAVHADNARFDLIGPRVDVRVTRGATTLPIAQVPNLQPGDKLWIKADLPSTQSNHLLLIVAFLRGTTNEPPDNWFTEIDTWDKKKTAEGTTVTVPEGAEQALMFIAPETGGDFKTLRGAVKGRPGLFIRADSDLNEASFEQQRIERYLAAMKTLPADDPKAIQDHSAKLAATLALKPNADCMKQPVDQQVTCLTQSSAPQLLSDGHSATVAEALATGPSSDFINAASYTQAAGAGLYSAYVGAVVDLVHLVGTLRTAQYQYIPGLSFPKENTLNLRLNAPVSFINPKSVIVIGLPAIQKATPPPLKAHDPNQVACLLDPKMALQLEGAPLVFSSSFAHDLTLHLNRTGTGKTDLPLRPDAFEGGLVLDTSQADRRQLTGPDARPVEDSKAGAKQGSPDDLTITGTVHGYWGFDSFDGPTLTLQQVAGKGWKIVGTAQPLAGKEAHLTLAGEGTACIQQLALTPEKASGDAKTMDVSFKPAKGDAGKNTLDLTLPLKDAKPGDYALDIQQFGVKDASKLPLTAFAGDIKLDTLKIHAGDSVAELDGQGLDKVASVELAKQIFKPEGAPSEGKPLQLKAAGAATPNDGEEAKATLKDGRVVPVKVSLEAARPTLQLLSRDATPSQGAGSLPVTLGGKDDIPLDGTLTFVVQTRDAFPRAGSVEVATADGAVHTSLTVARNGLVLQDEHTAVATLEPLKAFGASAFGKLQMRPVAADGTPGDWTVLGTLVRTPHLTAIHCTTPDAPTCTAEGSQFFLVQAFGAGKDLAKPTVVPTGYAQGSFTVPTPADGATLYLKLRDDPSEVATVTLPTPLPKPTPAAPPAPAAPAASNPAPAAPAASNPASAQPQGASPAASGNPAPQSAPSASTPSAAPATPKA